MSSADEPHLKVERDGSVVVLTMNNPRRQNALTPSMLMLMAQAWDEIDADDGIRAAILTGGRARRIAWVEISPTDGWFAGRPTRVPRRGRNARLRAASSPTACY